MPPAIIGGAIAAGGAVAASSIGSSATGRAADAQTAAAAQNTALQSQIYNRNAQTLAPYVNAGMPATAQINDLLGLSGGQGSLDNIDWAQYVQANPDALQQWQTDPNERAKWGGDLNTFGRFHYQNDGAKRDISQFGLADKGFENFRNSTGYQFQMNEAMRGVNSGYAGLGALKSGAALKAAQGRASDLAGQSFTGYLGALGNQQGLGMAAASAQAGVGQNYANSMTQINQNAANGQSNAALAQGQNSAGLVNSLASIGGNIIGQSNFGGSGFNSNALNAGTTSAMNGLSASSPFAGQTNDWRSW